MSFTSCPHCKTDLTDLVDGRPACPNDACSAPRKPYVFYNNPIPTAATLIPMHQCYIGIHPKDGEHTPPIGVHPRHTGIVLVKRGVPPFKGKWCLPCGYIEEHAHPKQTAVKESEQEAGLIVRLEQLVCYCNPAPGMVNQSVAHYVGRAIGGTMRAGDDAADVGIFGPDDRPILCFGSHERIVRLWFNGELPWITGVDLTN